ncbi:MAG TPA: 50S ribosomal protein L24 [Candidatus Paceibacterota bacterium]|nr:50S ribosomal protein L24 [Candidatus Paceibacterota bacterium]
MNIRKGDTIKILQGKDRGKTGKVLSAHPEDGRIVVEGLNVYKKRSRPKKQGQKGETVLVPRAFPASKAALVCGSCKAAARVGFHVEGNAKVRYCKKCGANT